MQSTQHSCCYIIVTVSGPVAPELWVTMQTKPEEGAARHRTPRFLKASGRRFLNLWVSLGSGAGRGSGPQIQSDREVRD